MSKTYNINLQDFRTQGSKVFASRARGKQVRKDSKIDEIETSFDKITISIPVDISSINPSFLEEFLENVVAKLGESSFYSKFSFVNPGRYKIVDDLSEAVDRILRDTNAIA